MFFPFDVYLAWQAGSYLARNYEPMTILVAVLLSYFIASRLAAVGGLIGFLIYRNNQLEKLLAGK